MGRERAEAPVRLSERQLTAVPVTYRGAYAGYEPRKKSTQQTMYGRIVRLRRLLLDDRWAGALVAQLVAVTD
jgi:hypothetical protein